MVHSVNLEDDRPTSYVFPHVVNIHLGTYTTVQFIRLNVCLETNQCLVQCALPYCQLCLQRLAVHAYI
jgi:hypothetical protein